MDYSKTNNCIAKYGLTVESVFVPWKASRNRDEKQPSLNWRVELKRDDRKVVSFDYSAGLAHCPYYKKHVKGTRVSAYDMEQIERECRFGKAWIGKHHPGGAAILPDTRDVIALLVFDASVLDAGGFESWASDLGYDPDSRKAETIYQVCLDIALKLRAAIGDEGLRELVNAFRDY